MTILPIVGRELRVASRKRGTYWTRVIAAAFAIVLMGSFIGVWSATRQFSGANSGQILFSVLKWFCFVSACGAGMFLTSDCLSEEKRDGTLGLLFLTDLRGYDVVVGKLIATSLHSVYALLAIFPVLGLTLMLGGVSGGEFWRTMLALCNALLFSLAAGVFISAISRDTLKAMSATLLLCVLALGGPPLLDLWRADWDGSNFTPKWTLASPAYAFTIAPQRNVSGFWLALALTYGMTWLFFGLASLAVPRTWQEKSNAGRAGVSLSRPRPRWSLRPWRFASRNRRIKCLETNPLIWLAGRDSWLTHCALVVAFVAAGLAAVLYLKMGPNSFQGVMMSIHALLVLALYLWVAAQASRFFVETRRTGALELILCTPVTVAQIVRGQWAALQRMFITPAAIILVMKAASTILQTQMFARMKINSSAFGGSDMELYQIISSVTGAVEFVTGLCALGWFGMWMGLTTKKPGMAVIKTLAFVVILPLLAAMIFQMSIMFFINLRGRMPFWSGALITAGFGVAKDLSFIFWSRWKLHTAFRPAASSGDGPTPVSLAKSPDAVLN